MEKGMEKSFNQQVFDEMVSTKVKLIRTEADLTQDKLAEMIGISKKTLVQVEKGRKTLGFTASALTAVLFRNGEIVQSLFGDSLLFILDLVANRGPAKFHYPTMGGKVWWTEEKEKKNFRIQRHVLTGHYRIINGDNDLYYYSVDREEACKRLEELIHKS